ncbi:hypothetical protein CBR_g60253 [Chara braunii]|uniref:Glycosyl transferase family 1 domain-containing protein n=1 Tax=Chara braunii TaxID=69332 RepID=A0A388MF39_CHABU|nr:hypothetical protein CBR_g60253 [Chara braunii]|eukprot:GBG93188.1 hypothetical protein CBR_g60253 [Chara braunii]
MDHLACPCVAAASARHLLATMSAVDGFRLQCHSLSVARQTSGTRSIRLNLSTTFVDGSGTLHMRQSNLSGGRRLPMPAGGNGPSRDRTIAVSASVETPGMSGGQKHHGVSTHSTAESSNRVMVKTGAMDGLSFLAPDMGKISLVFVGADWATLWALFKPRSLLHCRHHYFSIWGTPQVHHRPMVFEVKPILKKQLQVEAGLPVHPEVPLFGFMGRLDEQKASDLLAAAILDLMEQHKERDFQFVMLGCSDPVFDQGTGKPQYEKQLQALEARFAGKVRTVTRFSHRLAHLITAGCDFMVLPSRFEPAGLVQLHAMLYGKVPVVASTGGLLDSVRDGVTGLQMGTFNVKPEVRREDVMKVVEGLKRAMRVFSTHSLFRTMVTAAMSQDLSWKGPARAWEQALLQLRGDVHRELRELVVGLQIVPCGVNSSISRSLNRKNGKFESP